MTVTDFQAKGMQIRDIRSYGYIYIMLLRKILLSINKIGGGQTSFGDKIHERAC